MNVNFPYPRLFDEDENFVVPAYGFPILRGHPGHRNVGACEIDGFNRSLNLPLKTAPQFCKRGPSPNSSPTGSDPFAIFGLQVGNRTAVVRVSRIGKSSDNRPYGFFAVLGSLGLAD